MSRGTSRIKDVEGKQKREENNITCSTEGDERIKKGGTEMRKPSLGKPDNLPLLSCTQPDLPGQIGAGVGITTNGKENSTAPHLGSPDAPHYTQVSKLNY